MGFQPTFGGFLRYQLALHGYKTGLRRGHGLGDAARFIGVSFETLDSWLKDEPTSLKIENMKKLEDRLHIPISVWQAALRGDTAGLFDCDTLGYFYSSIDPTPHIDISSEWKNFYNEHSDFLHLEYEGKIVIPKLPVIVEHENCIDGFYFSIENIIINKREETFFLPDSISDSTRSLLRNYRTKLAKLIPKDRLPHNGDTLRLKGFEVTSEGILLYTQLSKYFAYIATNLLAFYVVQKPIRQMVTDLCKQRGHLNDLGNSIFGNVLGVNIFVSTRDEKIIFQRRSHLVATFPCKLGPSISGTLSPAHIEGKTSMVDMLTGGEVHEELSLLRKNFVEESWRFLGLARDLLRAGNPDLFFYVRTSLSASEVEEIWRDGAKDRYEAISLLHIDAANLVGDDLNADQIVEWAKLTFQKELSAQQAAPATQGGMCLLVRHRMREVMHSHSYNR